MPTNAMIGQLNSRPEYSGKTPEERASLANQKRVAHTDSEKKNFNWFLHSDDFTPAQVDAFAKLLLDTGRHAVHGTMIGEGLPFDTDKMQAGLDEIALQFSSRADIVAMVAKLKSVGRKLISDYEAIAGIGQVATAEQFAAVDAEQNQGPLLGLIEQAASRAKLKVLSGQLTNAAQVKAELGS